MRLSHPTPVRSWPVAETPLVTLIALKVRGGVSGAFAKPGVTPNRSR